MKCLKHTLVLASLVVALSAPAQRGGFGGASSAPWADFKLPKSTISLDFTNASPDMVIKLLAKASGVTILKDPALVGRITISSATKVPLDEAFSLLNSAIGLQGFEMLKEGKHLVIKKKAQQSGRSGMMGGGSMPGGFDMSQMGGGQAQEVEVFRLKYASAAAVARTINEIYQQSFDPSQMFMQMGGGGGAPGGPGQGGGRGGRGGFNFSRPSGSVRASADDYSNSVIVRGGSRDLDQIAAFIDDVDKDVETPLTTKVFKFQFALATEAATTIQSVLNSRPPTGRGAGQTAQQGRPQSMQQFFFQGFRGQGGGQNQSGSAVADARTNSVVVTTTEGNVKLVEQLVAELDVETKVESTTFVFPLNNARADQVADLLGQAFGTRTGFNNRTGSVGQRNPNTRTTNTGNRNNTGGGLGNTGRGPAEEDPNNLSIDLADPRAQSGELETMVAVAQGFPFGTQQRGNTTQQQGTPVRDSSGRIVNSRDLTNQVTVIPDQNTNSLIIVTSPDNMELIKQILGQIDRIPEQVMIETVIVEATLDRSEKLGVEWSFARGRSSASQGFGLQNASPALQGFRYTLTPSDFGAFVNALQSDQKFQILSTPRIFTSNNAEAQINISQRVPYVVSTREDANGNLTFNYAFQDVGIVLTVTPRITSNGYVTMEINQTANDLQGYTSFNAPIVNQREADTTVSVKDGETIILGGIIRDSVTATTRKIPLLGDLPILGNLFKTTDKNKVKTELMVFLTPRLVKDSEEARKLRDEQIKELAPRNQELIKGKVKDPVPDGPPPSDTTQGDGGATPTKKSKG